MTSVWGPSAFAEPRGTIGTQASFLELFQGDHEKVEALDQYGRRADGFRSKLSALVAKPIPRKVDAGHRSAPCRVSLTSLSKFGNDLRLLAHLQEVEEPFEDEQVGSSAMPYKRNPDACRADLRTWLAT